MNGLPKSILVVEDDNLLRKVIIDQLNTQYSAIPARDGQEALEQIESHRPDAVILDLLLPKVDGFAVLEQLRANADVAIAKIPVIVVSNLADPNSMERVKQYNVTAYFTKSDISLGILLNRLRRLFEEQP